MRSGRVNTPGAFTLVELLAVVMVIALLAALVIGITGYVQRRALTQVTRAQIAMLEIALDNYRADWGHYPRTTPIRSSTRVIGEGTNNAILYRALYGQGKQYLPNFPSGQLRPNNGTATNRTGLIDYASALTNIFDVYGIPFNYYNSPGTTFGLSNNVYGVDYYCGYAVGGQVNRASFDLFSYGPDHLTYVPGAFAVDINRPWAPGGWALPSSEKDDITNWRQ